MGADSIVLAEAIRVIEDTFLLRISIRQLFEQVTTLDALAAYIEQRPTPAPAPPDTPRAADWRTSRLVCAMPLPPAPGFAEQHPHARRNCPRPKPRSLSPVP